jgi:signal transduction histidine kinase
VTVADLDVDEIELLHRVGQEGLRNVAEHADAQHVAITVQQEDAATVTRVVDDGRGIAPGPLPERPGHLGLREPAGLAGPLGATPDVDSLPGRGTVLRLEVPAR